MSSKLVSIAKVVYSAKAAAARSAPAAIVGPLQKIFGAASPEETEEENQEQQQEEEILHASSLTNDRISQEGGVLLGLVARAAASSKTASLSASPIESPTARQELKDFQQDFYRRATANANERHHQEAYLQDPDLSVPVGDDYLYLAQ